MEKYRLYHMNASEILDGTIAIYKKSFTQQVIVTAVMATATSVITAVMAGIFAVAGIVGMVNGAAGGVVTPLFILLAALAAILLIAALYMLNTATTAANMELARQVFAGEKPDARRAFSAALRALPRMFTVAIAEILMTAPVYAVLAGVVAAAAMRTPSSMWRPWLGDIETFPAAFAALVLAFTAAAFALTLFIITLNSAAMPASLFENRFFFGAVGRSVALVKKDYWRVMGLIVLSTLMIQGVYYSFTSIIQLFNAAVNMLSGSLADGTSFLLLMISLFGSMASFGVSLLLTPLYGIFSALLYMNQRIRHEGLDIEIRIDILAKEE